MSIAKLKVEVAWEALEDAFENNAHEVHSYLHVTTGEVTRLVDGVADPALHARVAADTNYRRIDPVSSREQYRWMERFIETVEEVELKARLNASIDGKGAFRRFKDALMNFQTERERWFVFRSERLRVCIEGWLQTQGLEAVRRPKWEVPIVQGSDAEPNATGNEEHPLRTHGVETTRRMLHALVERVPSRDMSGAIAFLEFLVYRHSATSSSDDLKDATQGVSGHTEAVAIPVSIDVKSS